MIFGQNCCGNMEKQVNLKNYGLILVDYYSAIYSIRGIDMVLKWPIRPIFLPIYIKCLKTKHWFVNVFGPCTDIWIINSEWHANKKNKNNNKASLRTFEQSSRSKIQIQVIKNGLNDTKKIKQKQVTLKTLLIYIIYTRLNRAPA